MSNGMGPFVVLAHIPEKCCAIVGTERMQLAIVSDAFLAATGNIFMSKDFEVLRVPADNTEWLIPVHRPFRPEIMDGECCPSRPDNYHYIVRINTAIVGGYQVHVGFTAHLKKWIVSGEPARA